MLFLIGGSRSGGYFSVYLTGLEAHPDVESERRNHRLPQVHKYNE